MDESRWASVEDLTAGVLIWIGAIAVLLVVSWLVGCGPHGGGYGDSFSIVVQNASSVTVGAAGIVINGGRTPGRSAWTLGPIRSGDSAVVTGLLVPWSVDVTASGGGRRWSITYRAGVDYPAIPDGRVLVVLQ